MGWLFEVIKEFLIILLGVIMTLWLKHKILCLI